MSIFETNDTEYALLDEDNNRVIYIYRRFDTLGEGNESIPQSYLPQGYIVPDAYYNRELEGYYMYCFEEDEELRIDGKLAWNVVKEHSILK